jgi:hypothetical protein
MFLWTHLFDGSQATLLRMCDVSCRRATVSFEDDQCINKTSYKSAQPGIAQLSHLVSRQPSSGFRPHAT